jgi:hypothetical protein
MNNDGVAKLVVANINFMFFVNIPDQRATLDFSVMSMLPLPSLPTPDHLSFPRQGDSGIIIYLKE